MASSTDSDANDEVATAIGRYVLGDASLAGAAEAAGMTRWEFESILEDAGFSALYGPRSSDELETEVEDARDLES